MVKNGVEKRQKHPDGNGTILKSFKSAIKKMGIEDYLK